MYKYILYSQEFDTMLVLKIFKTFSYIYLFLIGFKKKNYFCPSLMFLLSFYFPTKYLAFFFTMDTAFYIIRLLIEI